MNLNDAQRAQVAKWIADGLKLSEIQTRLDKEMGLRLTYMEVRLLMDDLKLQPKDQERAAPVPLAAGPAPAPAGAPQQGRPTGEETDPFDEALDGPPPPAAAGNVSVTVDQLARPGAIASGKVTFSDGKRAEWYLDQMGRLGLSPEQPGYRPPAADVSLFQMQLQAALARAGYY